MSGPNTPDKTIKKKCKYNKHDSTHHVNTWSQSGLSMTEYCRNFSIPISTFSSWVSQSKKAKSSSPFKQLTLPEKSVNHNSKPMDPSPIQVSLPNGMIVKCDSNYSPIAIAILAKELMSCN